MIQQWCLCYVVEQFYYNPTTYVVVSWKNCRPIANGSFTDGLMLICSKIHRIIPCVKRFIGSSITVTISVDLVLHDLNFSRKVINPGSHEGLS